MTHQFNINLGDWSDDGHGRTDRYVFESNYSVKELQEAYKASCKKTGVDLHNVCSEYEESEVEPEIKEKLESFGMNEPWEDGDSLHPSLMADVIVWFVGLSMPEDFECKRVVDNDVNFNGYWGNLNVSFGYGLY